MQIPSKMMLSGFRIWESRFSLAGNHRDVALKIKKKFQDLGYTNAVLDSFNVVKTFRNVVYEQMNYNVIASIEGTDYPDSAMRRGRSLRRYSEYQ